MKTIKKMIAVLMTVLLLSSLSVSVFAAADSPRGEKDIIRQEVFETTNTDFQFDFEETIKEGNKKYNLKSVSYEVLNSTPQKRTETVLHAVDFNNRYAKDVQPPKTVEIVKDGQPLTVNLESLDYEPTTIKNRSEIVSAYTDFSYKTVTPQPAATKTVTYSDNASGKEITATLQLKELKEVDGWAWRDDVTIPITFTIYDAEYYAMGDVLIPYNDKKPAIQGYENNILQELNLDTEKYRINDVQWDGEPYYVGEVKYRKATATGKRYAANYVAIYESPVKLPDVAGYNAVATYKNTVDIENGETNYKVQATAIYQPDHTVAYAVAGVTLGVIFLALFVVLILYIVSKKKQKSE